MVEPGRVPNSFRIYRRAGQDDDGVGTGGFAADNQEPLSEGRGEHPQGAQQRQSADEGTPAVSPVQAISERSDEGWQ